MPQNIDIDTLLARRVVSSVESRSHTMVPDEYQTISQLCEPGLWSSLTPGERKQAGRIIAAAVQQGRLPLKATGRDSRNHQTYGIP